MDAIWLYAAYWERILKNTEINKIMKKICLLPCFVFCGGICGLYVCSLCNGFFGIHNVRNFADDSFVYNVFV